MARRCLGYVEPKIYPKAPCTVKGSFKGYYKGSYKGSIGFRVFGSMYLYSRYLSLKGSMYFYPEGPSTQIVGC